MKIHDISPPLKPGIPHWPGDLPFQRKVSLRIADGATVNLSSLTMSLHTGAHADAPNHYLENGKTIDRVDLSTYLGPALLIDARVEEKDIQLPEIPTGTERLLVRTKHWTDRDAFPAMIPTLSPRSCEILLSTRVRLLGLDLPSVDAIDSKDLPRHHFLGHQGIAILENLLFPDIPQGTYELVALPLPLAGADGSPVRAVLIEPSPVT